MGGCQSEKKVVIHNSKSDLPLEIQTFSGPRSTNLFLCPEPSINFICRATYPDKFLFAAFPKRVIFFYIF